MALFRIIASKTVEVLIDDVEAATADEAVALVEAAFDNGDNYADRWVVNEGSDKYASLQVLDVEEVKP